MRDFKIDEITTKKGFGLPGRFFWGSGEGGGFFWGSPKILGPFWEVFGAREGLFFSYPTFSTRKAKTDKNVLNPRMGF